MIIGKQIIVDRRKRICYVNMVMGCTAPDTNCPYWQGTFCALDVTSNIVIVRNCHKCVYDVGCQGNPIGCKKYKCYSLDSDTMGR